MFLDALIFLLSEIRQFERICRKVSRDRKREFVFEFESNETSRSYFSSHGKECRYDWKCCGYMRCYSLAVVIGC